MKELSSHSMPTAAKLFAAFAFMLVGFFTAEVVKPHMPDGTQFGAFSWISAILGLLAGWRIMGPSVGRGNPAAVGTGIKSSAVMVAWALVIFSTENMIVQAFRRAYDDPFEAVVGIVKIGIDYAQVLLELDVLAVLAIGGALGGLLAEWAWRRWA
jgi:hypothetical protein